MPNYPQLVYLSVSELVGGAGGDPWQIDDTIQAGVPGEISELATAAGAAIIGGLLGGFAGSDIGGGIGANFDPNRFGPGGGGGGSW